MHAANTFESSGSKFSKIAIVAALHAGFAIALIGMKVLPPEKPVEGPPVTFVPTPVAPLDPAPSVPTPANPTVPTLYIPPEVPVQADPDPGVTTTMAEPQPSLPATSREGDGGMAGASGDAITAPNADAIYKPAVAGDCTLPDYPARAARNGDTGTVTLALLIGANGRVGDARIEKSSGHRELDRAAMSALSMCKFAPASNNGVPEAAWGRIAYVWTLD